MRCFFVAAAAFSIPSGTVIWIRFVTVTYPNFALFEFLLFLDTFCNTNVSKISTRLCGRGREIFESIKEPPC